MVIAVVGITSQLEGEEMPVSEPGFKGGDRTSLDLPKPDRICSKHWPRPASRWWWCSPMAARSASTGPRITPTPSSTHGIPAKKAARPWLKRSVARNNPAGRLPVTFYKDVSQLPPFEDYAMKGRTYRYFEGTPLYPFGYGLSYTELHL